LNGIMDKHELTTAEARQLLANAGERADGLTLTPIRAGAVGSLYVIRRRNAPDVVAKIYPQSVSDRMLTEAHVYQLLADDDVAVPRVLLADHGQPALPLSCLLMTKLPGQRLADVRDDLTEHQLIDVYREMAGILKRVHRHRFAACGPIVGGRVTEVGRHFLQSEFTKQLQDFQRHGGSSSLAPALSARLDASREALDRGEAGGSLCHNDYIDGNILVSADHRGWSVTGVVDVERAIVADPLYDLSRITRDSTPWAAAFADAYGVRPGDEADRLAFYELHQTLHLWNWFSETGWAEQLPALERELEERSR
jgi:aminoglycoside phosphotransferase (APT) family kinase protein